MESKDTSVANPQQSTAHGQTTEAATAGAEKPNVFNELLGHLGDHHEVSLEPLTTIPLPYLFWDQDGFHFFGSQHALTASGTYTADFSKESSPIAEKGAARRVDGKPISLDMSVTTNLFFLGTAALILLVVLRIAASRSKKSLVPRGISNVVEVLIVFVRDEIVYPNVERPFADRLMPFFLTIFFFIFTANLLGLVPWGHTATSGLGITAALAICTFVVTQFIGIRSMGIKHYLLHFTGGLHEMEISVVMKVLLMIIMIPIEIMGLFTKPFALAIRLFANMTAGHIVIFSLIGLTFLFKSLLVGTFVSVPFTLFIFVLEIFVASLQAFIFTILSAVFIGFMAHTPHEEHAEDHDLAHQTGDHLIATSHTV